MSNVQGSQLEEEPLGAVVVMRRHWSAPVLQLHGIFLARIELPLLLLLSLLGIAGARRLLM